MTRRKIFKRLGVSLLVCLIVLAAVAWWRMGGVVVEVGEEGFNKPGDPASVEFSVVTYNVQARPWFDDSNYKFTHISPLLNPFDLVSIQECFKDYERLWDGTTHPVRIYHSRLKSPWKVVGSGLGILGRFPLEGVEAENFEIVGDRQNWPASKGLLLARFRVGGMPLDFYATHMEAGKKADAMWSRREQAEQLVRFVRRHSPPGHAVIFAGDFNMRPVREDKGETPLEGYRAGAETLVFDAMTREQVFDAVRMELALKSAVEELAGPVYNGVDHVLYRSGDGLRLTALDYRHDDPAFYGADGKPLSDHEPLIVQFRLERAE